MKLQSSGVTLVEIMVALILSSFLMLCLTSLFGTHKKQVTLQNELLEIQEKLLFTMNLLEHDLSHTGHFGCFVPGLTTHASLLSQSHYAAKQYDLNAPIQTNPNELVSLLYAVPKTSLLLARDSDTHHERLYFNNQNSISQYAKNTVFLISDCQTATTGLVTAVHKKRGYLEHKAHLFAQYPKHLHGLSNDRTHIDHNYQGLHAATTIHRLERITYKLIKKENVYSLLRNQDALIDGIQTLTLEFGQDTNCDGIIEAYTDKLPHNTSHIASARITLTFASQHEQSAPFTQTIRLENQCL